MLAVTAPLIIVKSTHPCVRVIRTEKTAGGLFPSKSKMSNTRFLPRVSGVFRLCTGKSFRICQHENHDGLRRGMPANDAETSMLHVSDDTATRATCTWPGNGAPTPSGKCNEETVWLYSCLCSRRWVYTFVGRWRRIEVYWKNIVRRIASNSLSLVLTLAP